MTRISHRLAAGGLALALIACGEDNICLNCGAVPEPTPGPRDVVSVEGNIRNWDTQDDLTRIKVIGCIDLAPDAPPEAFTNCPNTGNGFPDSSGNFTGRSSLPDHEAPRSSERRRVAPQKGLVGAAQSAGAGPR